MWLFSGWVEQLSFTDNAAHWAQCNMEIVITFCSQGQLWLWSTSSYWPCTSSPLHHALVDPLFKKTPPAIKLNARLEKTHDIFRGSQRFVLEELEWVLKGNCRPLRHNTAVISWGVNVISFFFSFPFWNVNNFVAWYLVIYIKTNAFSTHEAVPKSQLHFFYHEFLDQ